MSAFDPKRTQGVKLIEVNVLCGERYCNSVVYSFQGEDVDGVALAIGGSLVVSQKRTVADGNAFGGLRPRLPAHIVCEMRIENVSIRDRTRKAGP